MTLTAGTKLGSYEVVAQIGAGGMGEVIPNASPAFSAKRAGSRR